MPQAHLILRFSPADFLRFLEKKVESVRHDIEGAHDLSLTSNSFCSFQPCSNLVVHKLVKDSLSKSCELDPVPTFIVKEFSDVLVPMLTRLCNASVSSGYFPSSQKEAIVIPALKKQGLDPVEMKNFRPISNLRFTSKLVEKVVCLQLIPYLAASDLWPKLQSGFRRFHSTETAVLKVLSDIYNAIDGSQVVLLALLDVSAAFDTVGHSILLHACPSHMAS